MSDPALIAIIVATFLIAGLVKGVIGLGLPSISLGLLTAALDLPTAMVVLLVPSFITNLWQAAAGANGKRILLRIWPFLLMATASVWIGATALTSLNLELLSALLGVLLIFYAAINLAGFQLAISARQEVWAGPLIGTMNGILTGMTGSFVVPGVMFLQAIGLPRDSLIQAMGMLFTVSTLALAGALQANSFVTPALATLSAAALLPAIFGMAVGKKIRQRLPEQVFRRVFFIALLILGGYIIGNAALNFA